MSIRDSAHLSADDLDLLLANTPTPEATAHVSICDDCRKLVDSERWLIAELESLPTFEPGLGFADRVIAEVAAGGVLASPRSGAVLRFKKSTVVALSLLGMTVSAIWTIFNRPLFDQLVDQITGFGARWTDLALQNAIVVITAQSWFAPISTVLASPLGWVATGGAVIGLWATGMLALRKLVTTQAGTATEAGW